jgi:hypothetical protein
VTLRELRSFLRTAAAVTARPARFAASWAAGEREALNPLGFMATAAAIVTIAASVGARVAPLPGGSSTLLGEALDSLGPYVHYVALGLICHAVLRVAGSRRPVLGSVAMSLFLGGGPSTIATLIEVAMFLTLSRWLGKVNFTGPELTHLPVLAAGVVVWTVRIGVAVCFVRAFAGLHRVRTVWALLGLVVALAITGLIFGLLQPPGRFGEHLIIGHLTRAGRRTWWPAWAPM